MFIDSHCHLDKLNLDKYHGDLDAAISAAFNVDVSHMLCVCIDLEHFHDVLSIAHSYNTIYASVGVHPTSCDVIEPSIDDLCERAADTKVIAIGETGLDYHYGADFIDAQKARFVTHIRAANQAKKPLIIHTRNAREDTIALMKAENAKQCGGVMHCFTESKEMAKEALELGFYISFSGIVTFKNAKALQEVAKYVPLDRMLIETDSPYLAPVPYRGKPNEPANVVHVASFLSDLLNLDIKQLASQTSTNFFKLFSLESN